MRTALCLVIVSLLAASAAQADDAEYAAIRSHMAKLAPLVGNWNAEATFYDAEGKVRRVKTGTYAISWVLDDTYLEWRTELRAKDDPSNRNGFIIYLTFDPRDGAYHSTYFYTRWALRVSEQGEYDDATRELRTTAFIPKEDGKRDEHVRTILRLESPTRLVYTHFSRYEDEPAERRDLVIILTKAGS
jgi:hypothetical protein